MANPTGLLFIVWLCLMPFLTRAVCAQGKGRLRQAIVNKAPEPARALEDSVAQIQVGGLTRSYFLHLPPAYDKNRPMAVVLAFHGGTGYARRMSRLTGDLDAVADQRGFIAIYPDGIDKHWNDGRETQPHDVDDVGFVSALIDQLAQNYSVDRRRVYATGISNGGLFTQRLACELSDKIAAIATVAATMPQNLPARCAPSRPIAVLMMQGTDDPFFPYGGGELKGAGHGGYGGKVLSAAEAVQIRVRRNKTALSAIITRLPDLDPDDGIRVLRHVYGEGQDGTEVVLYEIEGGGIRGPAVCSIFRSDSLVKQAETLAAMALSGTSFPGTQWSES